MKKISVIIPVYNTSVFLDECLSSVFSQTYKNIEIVVINDASTDNSNEVIERVCLSDDRVKAFDFSERSGVGAARNFGIKKATGDLLYFLDSDDVLEPNTLENLINHLQDENLVYGKVTQAHNIVEGETSEGQIIERILQDKNSFLKRHSTLNLLIEKKFVIKHELSFSEDVECFSESIFLYKIGSILEHFYYVPQAKYYWRKRNDPISNPSLNQQKSLLIDNVTHVYTELKDMYKQESLLQESLDNLFLKYYKRVISPYFSKKQKKQDELLLNLAYAIRLLDKKALKNYPFFLKREINSLQKVDIKKYQRKLTFHRRLRTLKNMFKGRTKFYLQLHRSIFNRLPMKNNLIVFESFLGKNYSDSPKNIYEYIQENNLNYECVWIFNETGKKIPGHSKQVKRFSLKYYYYLSRAKYWVSNSRLPKTLNKRKGNIYVQTWHGTPLKKLVFDMKDVYSANPNYKLDFYKQSRRWDYVLAPNQYSSDIFKRAFKFEKEVLEYGYPRNDILYQKNNQNDINALKDKLGLPKDKKIILYAPTWRDDEFHKSGKYKFNIQMNLEKMKKSLGEEYILLLRMHYFISDRMEIADYKGFVYDFSKYDDISHLYLLSDILITDYSSVFFDYANTKRPILFFTYDLEKYRDTLRGFYLDFENESPGPLLKNTDDLIHNIQNIEKVSSVYKDKYENFYERFCSWEDGNATERVVKKIFD